MRKNIILALALFVSLAAFAQSKTIIHFKSGTTQEIASAEIDSITFAQELVYDVDMAVTNTMNVYLGGGQYLVNLSDAPMDEDALPTVEGQRILRFYAIAQPPVDSSVDITLPAGTYVSSDSFEHFTLFSTSTSSGYLCVLTCTGFDSETSEPLGYMDELEFGQAEVAYNGNLCSIVFTGGYSEPHEELDFQSFRATYNGPKLEWINEDDSAYDKLTHDVEFKPVGASAGYYGGSTYGNYNFAFFNCPLDSEGYVAGAGELMNFEILSAVSQHMDLSLLPGEYTITSAENGPHIPGTFLSGVYYDYYGFMMVPIGTYYSVFDDNGNDTNLYGFVTGGTVTISAEADSNYRFVANLSTETGAKITLDYTFPASVIIDTTTSTNAPAVKSVASFRSVGSFKSCKPATSIMSRPNVLQLIKK